MKVTAFTPSGRKSWIHPRKLAAILEVKGAALFSKNFIIGPVFSVGFTFIMKLVYEKISGNIASDTLALSTGLLMNISMTGVYVTAACLAEEKENNTLRTLMTSSVNGMEFFLGSLLPVILMQTAVNVLCVFTSGFSIAPEHWPGFLILSAACSAIASVIGMIFGIFAKNQMSAGTITTPVLLVLMMIPMFAPVADIMDTLSSFLFTGILYKAVSYLSAGTALVDAKDIAVLAGEFLLSVAVFLLLYRRNGFER